MLIPRLIRFFPHNDKSPTCGDSSRRVGDFGFGLVVALQPGFYLGLGDTGNGFLGIGRALAAPTILEIQDKYC